MEIDARKLSCPAPVIMTKEAVEREHPEQIDILVDNEAARQNVTRFLKSRSYQVDVSENSGVFRITGSCFASTAERSDISKSSQSSFQKILVMIATDRIGFGDEELGLKLMINFIKTLKEMKPDLWKIIFVNNGVRLTAEGSSVLEELTGLVKSGVDILVCGTCLTHFNLIDKKQVGETTNMLDIITAMQLADKVINI